MQKTINYIFKNAGATLDENLNIKMFKRGYMVSVRDYAILSAKDKKTFKKELKAIKADAGAYVGVWIDNGLVYLDISKHFRSKADALKVAKDNKQLAIWDCAKKVSIYLQ